MFSDKTPWYTTTQKWMIFDFMCVFHFSKENYMFNVFNVYMLSHTKYI